MQTEFDLEEPKGFNTHRHAHNPKERQLHDNFVKEYINGYLCANDIRDIVFTTSIGDPKEYLTDREKRIVISTIQWLGSPVGQGFLNSNGFVLQNDNK